LTENCVPLPGITRWRRRQDCRRKRERRTAQWQLLLVAQERGFEPASAQKGDPIAQMLDDLGRASGVVIVFGSELTGTAIRSLVRFGSSLSDAKYICLGDGPNSRCAAYMGVLPNRFSGYEPDRERWSGFWKASIPELPGMNCKRCCTRRKLVPCRCISGRRRSCGRESR
jgi:hypothetical protein